MTRISWAEAFGRCHGCKYFSSKSCWYRRETGQRQGGCSVTQIVNCLAEQDDADAERDRKDGWR